MSIRKLLIFRLSSFGDVVLAMAALSDPGLRDCEIHWVVKRQFAWLLEGHPRISKVWVVDDQIGFFAWIRMVLSLSREGFDTVLDLHSTLRTKIARFFFLQTKWVNWKKDRVRLVGFFLFKSRWPSSWRPRHVLQRISDSVARIAPRQEVISSGMGYGFARPSLVHLLRDGGDALYPHRPEKTARKLGLVPASRWRNKEWPVSEFVKISEILGKNQGWIPTVLGREEEDAVRNLKGAFSSRGMRMGEATGRLLDDLRGLDLVISVDTGIAHVAQALGIRTAVVFGPTSAAQGFGVWGGVDQATALESDLWCRPCGKDGRYCFRPVRKALCLSMLGAEEVYRHLLEKRWVD